MLYGIYLIFTSPWPLGSDIFVYHVIQQYFSYVVVYTSMLGDVRRPNLLQGLASGGRVGGAEAVLREVEVQGGGRRRLHHLSFTSFILPSCFERIYGSY